MKNQIESAELEEFYNETLIKIADASITYRKKNKITNQELAERLDVATSLISRIESGNKNLSVLTICKLLQEMDCHLEFVPNSKSKNKGKE